MYVKNLIYKKKKDISITEIPLIKENELDSFNWNISLICGNSGSGKINNIETFRRNCYSYVR